MIDLPFDLTAAHALYLGIAVVGAAYVRGYSGFGFSALVVSSSALVMNPLLAVPVVIICDALMVLQQAPELRGHVDWRRVRTLCLGAAVGVPLGVWALNGIGVDLARALISAFVLAICGLMMAGWRFRNPVGDTGHAAVGLVSGVANAAAVGGLPVAAFFAAQPVPARIFRATLIAYFTLLDIWTLPLLWLAGLVSRDTFVATALAVPLLVLGTWAGGRHFIRAEPQSFRRFAVSLLAALAGLGLLKSVM